MSEQQYTRLQLLDQLVEIAHKLRDLEADYLEQQSVYQEQKELFMTILQKAKDGIVIIQDRTILLANPKICEMIGATLQEIVGSVFSQYFRSDFISEAVRRYEEWRASKSPSLVDRGMLLRKDGSEVDIEFDAARVIYEGEEAVLVIVSDLTYIKKAEEELVRLRQYQLSLVEHANLRSTP